MNIDRPIILCGFTSCGKSTIGALLAQELELSFYDTDLLLTEQEQMTIPQIFAKGGETLFRELEHKIAGQVCKMGPSVVSTGGGMMTIERNAQLLAAHGTVIYIQRPFEACYQSISLHPERPLFKDHPKEEVAEIYRKRTGLYERYAALRVKNDSTPKDAVRQIRSALER